ncbi:MarR family winged helix-turn-helix transcriptional regulator [Litorisediminicola beolgyonensis]|uniref:MarR family winged helix-turn-helix transcriptional regulator n=1 Tax=Litorisediminicola beolgyonensis TaxID=1173614 RepID=A0ABW3ZN62_9RHOB
MSDVDIFDLSKFLPYRMAVAADRLSARLALRYRTEFGISVADWRVLVHVVDAGSVSIRDIHQRVHLEKSKASRAASRLEAAGYLTKEVNAEDRRLVALTLTPKGHALMARLLPIAMSYQARLEALLAPHLDALDTALEIMIAEEL